MSPLPPSDWVYTQNVRRNKARRVAQSSKFVKLLEGIRWMWWWFRWECNGKCRAGKRACEGRSFFRHLNQGFLTNMVCKRRGQGDYDFFKEFVSLTSVTVSVSYLCMLAIISNFVMIILTLFSITRSLWKSCYNQKAPSSFSYLQKELYFWDFRVHIPFFSELLVLAIL